MKRLLRRAAAMFLTAVCLMSLSVSTVFAETEAKVSTEGTDVTDSTIANAAIQQALSLLNFSEEQLMTNHAMYAMQGDEATAELLEDLLAAKQEYGKFRAIKTEEAKVVQLEDGTYTVLIPLQFNDGAVNYVLNINTVTGQMLVDFQTSGDTSENQSLAEKLRDGGVYSAFGIVTVFAVLICISLLIYCFKYIHKLDEEKADKVPAAAPAPAPVAVAAPVEAAPMELEDENLIDDTELLLLITTALAAYNETPSNGLKVRSIRRARDSKWKRA